MQVGVQLLLFGLGMEFSIEKLKEVGSVAILGGFIQIVLFVAICAVGALAIAAPLSEGIFVGALVSMSSTSVVIKSLGERAGDRASQIVIGTLILQDCSVGLMFALMPVLASLNDPENSFDPEATGEIVLLILQVRLVSVSALKRAAKYIGDETAHGACCGTACSASAKRLTCICARVQVLLKLAMTLLVTVTLSKTLVPAGVAAAKRRFSGELFQLATVAYCLSCAWTCGKLGLSHELGAFLAGIMVSTCDLHAFVASSTEQVRASQSTS